MLRFAILLLALLLAAPSAKAQGSRADLNLIIAMDCSWSVSDAEYALQVGGVAAAFSDPEIISAIENNLRGRVSILIVHWSTSGTQKIAHPWATISNAGEAVAFAARVAGMQRQTAKGGTSIAGALLFSQNAFEYAPSRADRDIIDVIADGENNNGDRIEAVRDMVVRQGTTINALAVVNEVSYLHHYLRNRVIGGSGAFVERALDYKDFKRAFRKKLLREIKGELVTQNVDQPGQLLR